MKKSFYLTSLILLSVFLLSSAGCTRQMKKARYLGRADRYFKAGDYDRAEIEYLKVLRVDRTDRVASRTLGTIYFEQANYQKAFSAFSLAKQLDPDNPEVRAKLATIYSLDGSKPEALTNALNEAMFVVRKQPTNEEAILILASCTYRTNEFKPAEISAIHQCLSQLRQQPGAQAVFQIVAGEDALLRRNFPAALAAFKHACTLDPKSSLAYAKLAQTYLAQVSPSNTNVLAAAELALKTAADLSPIRSLRRLSYANFKLRTGGAEEAKKILQDLTAKAPDFVPAWQMSAQVAFDQKNFDECTSYIQKILARNPDDINAPLLKSRICLVKGEFAAAVEELDRLNKRVPDRAPLLYQLALAQLLNKDITAATASLNQSLRIDPDYVDANMLLAELNLRTGRTQAVIDFLTPFIKKQPNLGRAYVLLASAYQARGNLNGALATYRQLAQQFPTNSQAHYLMGMVLRAQNKPKEARQAFEKANEISPDLLPVVTQLVSLDVADKQWETALKRVQKVIAKEPKAAAPLYLEALVYQAQKDLDRAEATLLKAIEIDPTAREPYIQLSTIYALSDRQQQAIERLQGLLAKKPKDVGALMQMGIIYDRKKDYAKAAETYEKVLAVQTNLPVCLNNLAYLYSEHTNRLDRAFELAKKARELDLQSRKVREVNLAPSAAALLAPADPATADTLGWIQYRRGEYSEATALLRESAQNAPSEPEIQYHWGMASYVNGDEETARTAFTRCITLSKEQNKDFPGREDAAARLASLAIDTSKAGPELVQALQKRLADGKFDPIVLSRLAAIYQHDGAMDKAIDLYESALKANPQFAPLATKLAVLYATQAADLEKTNAFERAAAAYEKALTRDPKSVPALVGLARLDFERLKKPDKALELIRTARDLAPDDPTVSFAQGRFAFQRREYSAAYAHLRDSLRKLPTSSQLQYDFGLAAYSIGQVGEAQSALQTALQTGLAPYLVDSARRFLAMVGMAGNSSQTPQAMAQVAEILKADPNYVPALMVVALDQKRTNSAASSQTCLRILDIYPDFLPAAKSFVLLASDLGGNDQKAYDIGTKARQADPNDVILAKALGKIAYRLRNDNAARLLLRETTTKSPSDAESQYYLGMTHYRLKEKAEAKDALNKAVKLAGLSPQLTQEAQRVLTELK